MRKEAFVRHVEREIDITVGVNHRRIVETFAVFEINSSSFVSVMPYCNGGSLADVLRKYGPLPEKDARSVIVQILYGLLHLHTRREPIIHYDLKPANILFHDGEVRLSDFGLSKVMAPAPAGGAAPAGMELTSYGSGTHGYLPPECYDGDASRVCPKVDVFSAGVVHFVMLFFPQKPFFRAMNQQQILQMKPHSIRQETQTLEFPGKISAEAQAFLKRALAPTREERADVAELLADPHMQQKGR
jgi:tousled-like kinase